MEMCVKLKIIIPNLQATVVEFQKDIQDWLTDFS